MKVQAVCHEPVGIFFGTLFVMFILTLLITASSHAKVTGECSNCHTMHNSQNGTNVDPNGPNETLLIVTDCLGCHAAADGSLSHTLT